MKKIIIAAFAVMIGVAANAAAITWSLTSITATPDSAVASGWVAVILDSATYDTFTSLASSDVVNFATENAIATGSVKVNRGSAAVSLKEGDYAANDTIAGYMVIFDNATVADAKYYANTSVSSATISAGGADDNITFGTFAAATSGWNEIASIPEPTSALMLLVGLAGLALKRKVA